MSNSTTRSTVPCLISVMFSLTMNQPLPTLFEHMHWIVYSYAPFKLSKVGMNVIIFPPTRSLHDLTLLSFPQPLLSLQLLMPSVNLMASRTSRSLISADTFYLIPLWTLLCLQEWMMQKMKTLPLQECMTRTLQSACTQHYHCDNCR